MDEKYTASIGEGNQRLDIKTESQEGLLTITQVFDVGRKERPTSIQLTEHEVEFLLKYLKLWKST